jgi:hypothetical protein
MMIASLPQIVFWIFGPLATKILRACHSYVDKAWHFAEKDFRAAFPFSTRILLSPSVEDTSPEGPKKKYRATV